MKMINTVLLMFLIWNITYAQQGNFNTATGVHALSINDTGHTNTANGFDALRDNTSGYQNVACGAKTLMFNTSGYSNTAIGVSALRLNTSGRSNVAIGASSLTENLTGRQNTAVGSSTLFRNTSGGFNIAIGSASLRDNTTGSSNVAVGYLALLQNTEGLNNIAIGRSALSSNTGGRFSVAIGSNALGKATGSEATAVGHQALFNCLTGSTNVALGAYSQQKVTTGSQNVAVGNGALSHNITGNQNTALGQGSGPPNTISNLNNTTSLGFATVVTASNQVRVGNTNVNSIGGQVAWTTLSDGRFKSNVKTVKTGLDFINKLRPVTYTVNKTKLNSFLGVDNDELTSVAKKDMAAVEEIKTGFIAQEVEKALEESSLPISIVDSPKNDKDYYGIRYAEFVPLLVMSVQELSQTLEEQKEMIEKQQMQIDALSQDRRPKEMDSSIPDDSKENSILLHQNRPNPYTEETEIKVQLPENIITAEILLFDLHGKLIQTIPLSERGLTAIQISGSSLNAGVYIYTLIADGKLVDSKQLVLVE